jgi:iron complex outermembrane recepter protein
LGGLLACAQAAADEPAQLQTVVVTATRTARPAFEMPVAIDSVPAESIQDNQLGVNLSEDLDGVAGVLARNRQDYAQDQQLSVRGFGANAPFGIVGVRMFVDGVPATFPDGQGQASHFNLGSADRVEVLRGPFSALYGNASGGVIQIFTAPGGTPPEYGVSAAAGSYGTYRTEADARGLRGPLDYDLNFSQFHTDGYRQHSRANRDSGNVRLSSALGGGNHLTLVGNTVSIPEAQDDQGLTRAEFQADPRQVAPAILQFNTRKSLEQDQLGLVDEQALGGGQALRLMGYYGERVVKQYQSIPLTAEAAPTSPGGVVDLHSAYGGADGRWTWHADLLGGPFNLAAGLAYDAELEHRRGYNNYIGSDTGVQGALRRDEQDNVYDLDQYLQGDWSPAPRWSAYAGVRHSEVHFNSHDHLVSATDPDNSGSATYYSITPAAGLLYRVTGQLHLYAAYGQGFDTPTLDQLAYRPGGVPGLNFGLAPQRTGDGELGAKWRWRDSVDLKLALFRAQTRREIVIATATGGRSTYENAGRVRRQGLELEAGGRLAGRWFWQLAYTNLDATYREAYQTCASTHCPPYTSIPAGNHLPGIPGSVLHAMLHWRDSSQPGWNTAIEASYVATVQANDANTAPIPEYALLGWNGGYVWDTAHLRLRGFVRVDNLLDEKYAGAVVVDDSNSQYYEPGLGRSVLAGIDLRWKP